MANLSVRQNPAAAAALTSRPRRFRIQIGGASLATTGTLAVAADESQQRDRSADARPVPNKSLSSDDPDVLESELVMPGFWRAGDRRAQLNARFRFTKPQSSHRLGGVAMKLLLLISREPMQRPLAQGLRAIKRSGWSRARGSASVTLHLLQIDQLDTPVIGGTSAGFVAWRHRLVADAASGAGFFLSASVEAAEELLDTRGASWQTRCCGCPPAGVH